MRGVFTFNHLFGDRMNNYRFIKYHWRFYQIAFDVLKTNNVEDFEDSLMALEAFIIAEEELFSVPELWYKLHGQDTGAHDVRSIVSDLEGTKQNREYMYNLLQDCIDNASLKIHGG